VALNALDFSHTAGRRLGVAVELHGESMCHVNVDRHTSLGQRDLAGSCAFDRPHAAAGTRTQVTVSAWLSYPRGLECRGMSESARSAASWIGAPISRPDSWAQRAAAVRLGRPSLR
jgi:hypothetical protein